MSRTSAAEKYSEDSFLNESDGYEEIVSPEIENSEVEGDGEDPSLAAVGAATATSALTDQQLLEGIRASSEPHFAELYNRYFQRIYNFVYARMRNHAEAEEVVQETFLAVFRSFGNYRGQSSLLSWIYGIAKNTANNSIRRSRSQSERIDLADDEDLIPRISLDEGMPDEQLDLHRFREVLRDRLGSLADWQAEIFEMRHFENLSIPEISERTSRSSDAVRSSLYRVKRLFFEAAEGNHPVVVTSASNSNPTATPMGRVAHEAEQALLTQDVVAGGVGR